MRTELAMRRSFSDATMGSQEQVACQIVAAGAGWLHRNPLFLERNVASRAPISFGASSPASSPVGQPVT